MTLFLWHNLLNRIFFHRLFYLAEDSEGTPYEYTYRDLGLDIDPIFKSFNKSLDKIDEYGVCE